MISNTKKTISETMNAATNMYADMLKHTEDGIERKKSSILAII